MHKDRSVLDCIEIATTVWNGCTIEFASVAKSVCTKCMEVVLS